MAEQRMSASERYEMASETLEGLLITKFPRLKNSIIVKFSPRCPYLFAARLKGSKVLIETSLWFSDDRFYYYLNECARAALEVATGITTAVRLQERIFEVSKED